MGRGSQIDFTMGIATPAASFFSDSQVGDVIFRADQGGRILLGSGTGTPKSDTTITSTGTTTIGLRVSSGVVSSGTLFAVSTGPVDLFSVLATSANIKVPVFLNGGGVFNVGALTDFLSGFNLAHSTLIISIPISSVTASMSIDLGPISGQSQATITQIAATTLPTGTTGLFQLDYRSTTTIGTAGTSVFTVSYATATSPGKVYVSADFASAAIPKDYHLVLTTHPTTPQTGGVTNATVVLYYKEQ